MYVFACRNHEFIKLFCYTRSSKFYRALTCYAPYGKIAPLTHQQIEQARDDLIEEIRGYKSSIAENGRMINLISNWNNSIEDKLKIIEDYQSCIDDEKEEMKEAQDAVNILTVMLNVEAELYIGEECGPDVSVNDIVETPS